MMKKLLLVAMMFGFAGTLSAQKQDKLPKAPHFDIVLTTDAPDSLVVDSNAVYVRAGDSTVVALSVSPDSLMHVLDADGMDGMAAVALPAGEYAAYGQAVGKRGNTASLNGFEFTRGKGKPVMVALPGLMPTEMLMYHNGGLSGLQLRFYLIAAAPAPAPVDTVSVQ